MKKIKIIWRIIVGYVLKWKIDILRIKNISPLKGKIDSNEDIIVSLTSYGRRVNKTVYYTIVSILQQTVKPAKIILWLSETDWNIYNIPKRLKRLINLGIEIKFCKDIGPYTKFIHCYNEYPQNLIVTIDDDLIYVPTMLESLMIAHNENPKAVCCNIACSVKITDDGTLMPYKSWKEPVFEGNHNRLMPWGCWGILYPPHSLHQDINNEDLFLQLCPKADDIWFWIMGELNGTPKLLGNLHGKEAGYCFDDLYQKLHKNSSLTQTNDHQNENQVQLDNIIRHYKLMN